MVFILGKKNLTIVSPIPLETMIYADHDILKIILNNILHNAVKFSPSEEKIMVTFQQTKNHDQVCVTDFGVGMDKQTQEKILTQKVAAYSTSGTESEKGYGLGLKICFRMVDLLNGKVEINSKKDEGTQFIISIPRRDQHNKGKDGKPAKIKNSDLGQRSSDF